jgi:hypothetical protein
MGKLFLRISRSAPIEEKAVFPPRGDAFHLVYTFPKMI